MKEKKNAGYPLYWASQVVLVVKNSPANAGDIRDVGSVPELGCSPGGRHGNLLQYSYLENPNGQRSLAGYSPQGGKESYMTEVTEHTPSFILMSKPQKYCHIDCYSAIKRNEVLIHAIMWMDLENIMLIYKIPQYCMTPFI